MSRLLNVGRWSDHPEVSNCVSALVDEIDKAAPPRKARPADTQKKFRASVAMLALDLYVAHREHPDLEVAVPLSAATFSPGGRLCQLFLSYRPFKAAFDGLRDLGHLEITREGFNDPTTGIGRVTRVRATRKLLD